MEAIMKNESSWEKAIQQHNEIVAKLDAEAKEFKIDHETGRAYMDCDHGEEEIWREQQ
jgi:hypothetical protein